MFHKGVPNAARVHFSDLNRLFAPVIGQKNVDQAVEKFFSDQGRKMLRSEMFLPLSSSVKLLGTSRQLAKMLSNNERVYCLGLLLKLLKDNGQEHNKDLLENVRVVAEIFGYSQNMFSSLQCIYFHDFPTPAHYHASVIVSNRPPDFGMSVEGLRYLWFQRARVQVWALTLREADTVIFKVLENNADTSVFSFEQNDVVLMSESFRMFLSHSGVKMEELLAKSRETVSELPRVVIPPTELAPQVILDPVCHSIELNGHSLVAGSQKFYDPVFRWIEKLRTYSPKEVSLHIRLNYFNTYTSKVLLEIFLTVRQMEQMGTRVHYNWYYMHDDDELRETGEHYEDILKVNFRFIELEGSDLMVAAHE